MRIGYILGQFPKLSETFILNEISELIRRGHDVYIFSLFNSKENIVQPEVEEYSLLERTYYPPSYHKLCIELARFDRLLFYRNRRKINKFYCIAVARHFSKIAEKLDLDVLHAHFANESTFTAMLMSKLTGLSFTFTAHALDIFIDPDVKALEERMENASAVIAISEYNKKYLQSIYNNKKIFVVRACPNLEKLNKIRRDPEQFEILTVGRLVEKKGIKYGILAMREVVKEFPEVQYIIVGSGPQSAELKKLAKSLGLENNVRFLGAVDERTLMAEFSKATVFILPCVKAKNGDMDGIPVSLMEAMYLQIPVVSTNISGIPELIENGKEGLLVEPKNVRQLVNAIKILLEDKDLRIKMGLNGKRKIENRYPRSYFLALPAKGLWSLGVGCLEFG